jgi:hypothetical protein
MPIYLFDTVDPRKCVIKLDQDVFAYHIAKRHTMINVEHIERTVECPDFIVQDIANSKRENYYLRGLFEKYPQLFVKVCVENRGAYGEVITAFTTSSPKSQEVVIWPLEDNLQ